MRSALTSIGVAAAFSFASVISCAPPSWAVPAPAVATISASSAHATPMLQPMTKRIRKGVYKPSGWNCPKNARIKGNRSSHIFHMPGQRFYKRTKPELCFTTAAVARANGYRKSKV